MPRPLSLLLALTLALVPSARAEDAHSRAWIHVNGYTHHFTARDANSHVFGTGVTWHRTRRGATRPAWEADVFQDSARKLSAYAGHSWTRPISRARIGATAALMYHRNFRAHTGAGVLPVVLPFVEVRPAAELKLRIYYIPPVRARDDHQMAVQLAVPLSRRSGRGWAESPPVQRGFSAQPPQSRATQAGRR
jgi:hypothetical protein